MDQAHALRATFEKLYQEHRSQARHYDILRSGLMTVLATIAGALLAIATSSEDSISRSDFGLGITIFVVGAFGVLASLKLVEKLTLEKNLAEAYRSEIDAGFEGKPIERVWSATEDVHDVRWKALGWFRMRWLWASLAGLICLLGLVVIFLPYFV